MQNYSTSLINWVNINRPTFTFKVSVIDKKAKNDKTFK